MAVSDASMFPSFTHQLTAAVAEWLERQPREQEVVSSIPGRDRQNSLKLVVVASPLDAEDYGIALRLVKYWLKIAQETWTFELSPLKN